MSVEFVVEHAARPEYSIDPLEQRLADLICVPPEIAEPQRELLHNVVDKALQTATTEHEKQSIYLTGRHLEWLYLGQPGDPLPEGMIIKVDKTTSARSLEYDSRLGFSSTCAQASRYKFDRLGFTDINKMTNDHIDSQVAEIKETLEPLIKRSSSYQLLSSFNVESPATPSEKPLDPYWRRIYEQQAEQGVRERFGLTPKQPILRGSPADSALRKELWRLDDMTIPVTEAQSKKDGLTRAREYFAGKLVDTYLQAYNSSTDRQNLIDDLVANGNKRGRFDRFLYSTAATLAQEFDGDNVLDNNMAKALLHGFMAEIFDDRTACVTYPEFLQKAMEYATNDSLTAGLRMALYDKFESSRAYLIRPVGEEVSSDHLDPAMAHPEHSSQPGFMTRGTYERNRQMLVGHVAQGEVQSFRFMQLQTPRRGELPLSAPNTDLTIQLLPADIKQEPFIPGYRLVSRNNDQFGFQKEEADPYASTSHIIIPQDKRDALVETYKKLGLNQLAAALPAVLGVETLTQSIAAHSDYPMPTSVGPTSYSDLPERRYDELPSSFIANSLDAFAALVRGGRLQLQCTGAAHFLKLSLQEVFGVQSATTTGGIVLEKSNPVITRIEHEQTAFSHEGRTYILDATPSTQDGSLSPNSLHSTQYIEEQGLLRSWIARLRPRKATEIIESPLSAKLDDFQKKSEELEQQASTQTSSPYEKTEAERQQALKNTRRSLETHLGVILNIRQREELLRRLVQLPEADPIRRTLMTVSQASVGRANLSDVVELQKYIETYREAPEALRQKARVATYNPELVSLLGNSAANLSRHLAQ